MCVCDLNVGIDLRGSTQIPAAAADQSCAPTSSTNAFNGVDCYHPPRLPRPNPHSARGTTACHFPRFPSLEAFGRRPKASVIAAPSVGGRHPKPFTEAAVGRPHPITSSAIESTPGGTLMPSARAVWRLITNSNLVDCTTSRSAGLAPLRMLPVSLFDHLVGAAEKREREREAKRLRGFEVDD